MVCLGCITKVVKGTTTSWCGTYSCVILDLLFKLILCLTGYISRDYNNFMTSNISLLKSSILLSFYSLLLQVMDMLGPSLWDVWNTSGQA